MALTTYRDRDRYGSNSDKAEQTIVVDTEIGTDGDDATKAVSIDSITEDTADATDFITSDNQLVISGSVDLRRATA
ncbi:hypothetical protein [Vibrio vulnificus]|uniref:hypothetical protein n=1 Tax=Vibrio vulnificus TaxID=672 RepID=UPI00165E180D|nr:hypothetical protein [Vibrio vulnificus]